FVCIKVDREERPEIDDIYMTALIIYLQAAGSKQGGGWPLSMFLTPDGKPIAGGTYFPPEAKNGLPGFGDVMKIIDKAWKDNKKGVTENADLFAREVQRNMKPRFGLEKIELDRSLVQDTVKAIRDSADPEFGGVDFNAQNPDTAKFPVPVKLGLLQYDARRNGDKETEKVLDMTLHQVARGGIRDHLGGGFHRYSTDRKWLVPHFEKMLYDQAQLADLYIKAYRRTNDLEYRTAAEDTLNFVLNDLRDTNGGFYSALDAETDGVEGQYYVWEKEEVEKILGPDNAKLFDAVYGLSEPKNFEHGYVLHRSKSWDELAKAQGLSVMELQSSLAPMRAQMLKARQRRTPLLRDEKVLTSWNGLMIQAFAHAGLVLQERSYLQQ
ncbi:MAG: thioredoxin domain-containing protein, partial [Planctomycetaceae bacterium]|nr:thioredoxin domain-containing protein [Planctomycetaceae bacterium]